MKHLKRIKELKEFVETIPENPGAYLFYDKNYKLLYVGKAKNLKKRISSYFNNNNLSSRIKLIVIKIHKIEFIVTETENDALILENNLIKKLKPKYNILLKDDKTFPWLKLTNEEYPRILKTRKIVKDGSSYFGPYTSLKVLKSVEEIIIKIFNLRSCNLKLTESSIKNKKWKVCLEYHIKNCGGPCENFQNKKEYLKNVVLVKKFLNGEIQFVIDILRKKMYAYSQNLEYEKANDCKKKIETLKSYQSNSIVSSIELKNVNVIGFVVINNIYYYNYIKVNQGIIVSSYNFYLKTSFNETEKEMMEYAIKHVNELFDIKNTDIVVSCLPDMHNKDLNIIIPDDEKKQQLLKFSEINARTYANHVILNKLKKDYGKINAKLLETIKTELNLKNLPVYAESYDISHTFGDKIVGSCIVFVNGKPSKSEYRHFIIKKVTNIDDYAALKEVATRRMMRLISENKKLPDLIVVDGGKGQLLAVKEALNKMNLTDVEIISIAKRLEEIYISPNSNPLFLGKKSEALKFVQRMRNEAHRFAIDFHRKKKEKNMLTSVLDNIKGIGKTTKSVLYKNFNDIEEIKKANRDLLIRLIGKKKTDILIDFFKKCNL